MHCCCVFTHMGRRERWATGDCPAEHADDDVSVGFVHPDGMLQRYSPYSDGIPARSVTR